MDPLVVGAGIGAIGNALGGIGKGPRRQYKYAKKMFDYQAAYNHPTQQMARLKEAGLNPNLVYGEGTKGATGQQSGMDSIDFSQGADPGSIVGGAVEGFLSTRNAVLNQKEQALQNSLLQMSEGVERSLYNQGYQFQTRASKMNAERTEANYQSEVSKAAFADKSGIQAQADARRLGGMLVKQRFLNNEIDLFIKDATKADRIKAIASGALAAKHGATLREQESILKQAEVNLFKELPRSTVMPIIMILRMLINK